MDPERMAVYLESLEDDTLFPKPLRELEKSAREGGVPIIRPATRTFLRMMLTLKKPERILEVGCAVGYSALMMHECCPEAAVVTLEKDEARAGEAAENFERFGVSGEGRGRICLLTGDASDILPSFKDGFDFIFMDAAKGQYLNWLPLIKKLLPAGGLLISDNVLQEGDILESHYAVERRNRTIYKRMRSYLYELTHDRELVTSILADGDGIAVTVKK